MIFLNQDTYNCFHILSNITIKPYLTLLNQSEHNKPTVKIKIILKSLILRSQIIALSSYATITANKFLFFYLRLMLTIKISLSKVYELQKILSMH